MSELSFLRPKIPFGSHPIETGEYILGTPSTFEMFHAVKEWLDSRQPGGLVYGPPRIGKTRGIKYVTKQLKSAFDGKLPIVNVLCYEHKLPNENVFFEEFLLGVGHGFSSRGKALDKRRRLFEYLFGIAAEHPHKRLLIFLDEAQNLEVQHYLWLVDLYNTLDDAKIRPTFIMVGQKELAHRHNAMILAKRYQIIGRFMVNTHSFRGLTSSNDIEVCLHGYDDNTEYPQNSGWSFTRFYFPVAYAHGWRIISQADTIWEAFIEVKTKAKIPGYSELPMQFFSSAVEYIFRKYSNLKDIEPHLSFNIWKEAVEKSGYPLSNDFILAGEDQNINPKVISHV